MFFIKWLNNFGRTNKEGRDGLKLTLPVIVAKDVIVLELSIDLAIYRADEKQDSCN